MSVFACFQCNAIENTALSNFWTRRAENKEPLCSECDPETKQWHGEFEKRNFIEANYQICPDEHDSRIICPKPNGWDYCKHGKAPAKLDAKAWQRLSRIFNEKADLQDERDRQINEFLKKQIGQAVKRESYIIP